MISYIVVKQNLLAINLGALDANVDRIEPAAKSAFSRKYSSDVYDTVSPSYIDAISEGFKLGEPCERNTRVL